MINWNRTRDKLPKNNQYVFIQHRKGNFYHAVYKDFYDTFFDYSEENKHLAHMQLFVLVEPEMYYPPFFKQEDYDYYRKQDNLNKVYVDYWCDAQEIEPKGA